MKKWLVWLMLFCLLFTETALAAKKTKVNVAGSWYEDDSFFDEHDIQFDGPNYRWKNGVELLTLKNAPDLYNTSNTECDFQALKNAGLLVDLSVSPVLTEVFGRMRPEVQALATDAQGHPVLMVHSVHSYPIYWRTDAFAAAGLTEKDAPKSYTELLDFAETWVARIQKKPEMKVCFIDTSAAGGNKS